MFLLVLTIIDTPIFDCLKTPFFVDGFRRSHRLSLPGHRMSNYLKFLQELALRQVRDLK